MQGFSRAKTPRYFSTSYCFSVFNRASDVAAGSPLMNTVSPVMDTCVLVHTTVETPSYPIRAPLVVQITTAASLLLAMAMPAVELPEAVMPDMYPI